MIVKKTRYFPTFTRTPYAAFPTLSIILCRNSSRLIKQHLRSLIQLNFLTCQLKAAPLASRQRRRRGLRAPQRQSASVEGERGNWGGGGWGGEGSGAAVTWGTWRVRERLPCGAPDSALAHNELRPLPPPPPLAPHARTSTDRHPLHSPASLTLVCELPSSSSQPGHFYFIHSLVFPAASTVTVIIPVSVEHVLPLVV